MFMRRRSARRYSSKFNSAAWVSISKHDYKLCATEVGRYGFQFERELDAFIAELTPELERTILAETDIEATVYEPMPTDEHKRLLLELSIARIGSTGSTSVPT